MKSISPTSLPESEYIIVGRPSTSSYLVSTFKPFAFKKLVILLTSKGFLKPKLFKSTGIESSAPIVSKYSVSSILSPSKFLLKSLADNFSKSVPSLANVFKAAPVLAAFFSICLSFSFVFSLTFKVLTQLPVLSQTPPPKLITSSIKSCLFSLSATMLSFSCELLPFFSSKPSIFKLIPSTLLFRSLKSNCSFVKFFSKLLYFLFSYSLLASALPKPSTLAL